MRRLGILCVAMSLVFAFNSTVFANGTGNLTENVLQRPNFSHADINRLLGFGFSNDEIKDMSKEEYQRFNEKYRYDSKANLVSKETKYYRVKSGSDVVEISQAQAEIEVLEYKSHKTISKNGTFTPFATDTEQTSWMTMTTTSSAYLVPVFDSYGQVIGYTQDGYLLKNSFEWLTTPLYTLTDVIGISFNPNLTYVQNTEYAVYVREYSGSNPPSPESVYYNTAEHKKVSGIAFDIDLDGYSNDNNWITKTHRGYMTFQVRKNSTTATSTNAYGHYSHLYNTINFSVSIANGSMSITGVTQHDDMIDTGISFNF